MSDGSALLIRLYSVEVDTQGTMTRLSASEEAYDLLAISENCVPPNNFTVGLNGGQILH